MRSLTILVLTVTTSVVYAQMNMNLMPWPAKVEKQDGNYRIDKSFSIYIDGPESVRLEKYSEWFIYRLRNRTGLFIVERSAIEVPGNQSLLLTYSTQGRLDINTDESYQIEVSESGIKINASTDIGVMRSLETLLQLLSSKRDGFFIPACIIEDEPKYVWRGLLLDVSRHWMPIDVVKRNIDAMAAVKMNVLHLHLTDDQGFRIESKKFPMLHEMGSDGNYFTQVELREIVSYAAEKGIRVIPEFNVPGHVTSWLVGYPELASAPGPYKIERTFGVKDPTLDPTKEYTYEFLNSFFEEMVAIFPDEFVHIGGDENDGKQWDANSDIQNFMIKNGFQNNHELQSYFTKRIETILSNLNKRMVGWDEIKDEFLSKSTVIQSWQDKQTMVDAAEDRYDVILSNGYYLNVLKPASFYYLNDPIPPDSGYPNEVMRQVLGGEAAMWTELVDKETVDSRIWPRTAAIAERLWSPESVRDVKSMYQRLQVISVQLEEHGLRHLMTPGVLLRRIAGTENIETLKFLIDYIEPVEGDQRARSQHYTTYSPLNRWADIAQPDARKAREFNNMVGKYVRNHDRQLQSEIKSYLLNWIENHKKMKALATQYPLIREALPLSDDLSRIAVLGMQAMSENIIHDADWKKQAESMLVNAIKPKAECEIKIIDGIRMLVQSAD